MLTEHESCEQTDLATDVQADSELGSMGQTDHSQEVSEVRAGVCGAVANQLTFYYYYYYTIPVIIK